MHDLDLRTLTLDHLLKIPADLAIMPADFPLKMTRRIIIWEFALKALKGIRDINRGLYRGVSGTVHNQKEIEDHGSQI